MILVSDPISTCEILEVMPSLSFKTIEDRLWVQFTLEWSILILGLRPISWNTTSQITFYPELITKCPITRSKYLLLFRLRRNIYFYRLPYHAASLVWSQNSYMIISLIEKYLILCRLIERANCLMKSFFTWGTKLINFSFLFDYNIASWLWFFATLM